MSEVITIDRSFEVSPWPRNAPLPTEGAWLGAEITPGECIITLGPEARSELTALAGRLGQGPPPASPVRVQDHPLPALATRMARARDLLHGVPGVAVVDRLPMDEIDPDMAQTLFWLIGQHVARPVAQKWDGSLLYHVRDTGQRYEYGVRGSYTNVELVFHTDNAFAIAPPDFVGLMCHQPARSGGVSRFCSLLTVHNRMAEHHPRLLERLYQPMYWDRQAEHAPGAATTLRAPMFRHQAGQLRSRVNVSLVRKGYQVAGVPMDSLLQEALAALEDISCAPELWFELAIQRGQLQFLDNTVTAHYRSEFSDFDDPCRKRHLVRTWHRNWGSPGYDG